MTDDRSIKDIYLIVGEFKIGSLIFTQPDKESIYLILMMTPILIFNNSG